MNRRDFLKMLPLAAAVPFVGKLPQSQEKPTVNLNIPDHVWKKLMNPICVWTVDGNEEDVNQVFDTLKSKDGDTRTHFVTNISLKVQTVGSELGDAIKDALYKVRGVPTY